MEKGPTARDATLLKLWVIAFGAPGQIHVGTIPGGLFSSNDGGASFELNRPLWNHESRGGDLFSGPGTGKTHWFGTPASDGEFAAGIHSIAVDPRDTHGLTTLKPVFQLELTLPADMRSEYLGARVFVRFDHGYEPAGFQMYRALRQLLLRQFNV